MPTTVHQQQIQNSNADEGKEPRHVELLLTYMSYYFHYWQQALRLAMMMVGGNDG